VREKPQYRKLSQQSAEEVLLSNPDPALNVLKRQFGYNPLDAKEAIDHWTNRLGTKTLNQFRQERSAAVRTRILGKMPRTPLEKEMMNTRNFPDVTVDADDAVPNEAPRAKKLKIDSVVPAGLTVDEAIAYLCQSVIERGAFDTKIADFLYHLSQSLSDAAKSGLQLDHRTCLKLQGVAKVVFSAWSTSRDRCPSAQPFFTDLCGLLPTLNITDAASRNLMKQMCDSVLTAS
jgi:hypothetical protein